jgi:hypothetical protein
MLNCLPCATFKEDFLMEENKKGGRVYADDEYFAQVSNIALRDDKLSLKAKGLYALIKSYITIKDFTLYKNTLKKQCVEKEKAFEGAWKELKDNGYLIQYRLLDEKGQYYYEYRLLHYPNLELAKETHDKQNRKKEEEKNHTPKMEGMDKTSENHNPKKDNMDNGYDGKRGVYNKTNSSNTKFNNTYPNYYHKENKFVDNCSRREYTEDDFKNMEKKLLGWDKE